MKQHYKTNIQILLFSFGLSISFLLICSKTSFLYPFHDWFDSNSFLTVGRGMANGLIPYRDLFEQKGPILYFIHFLASLISDRTFFGVWIFQVLSFTLFLYYTGKTILLYLPKKYCYFLLPFFTFLIFMMQSYRYGDSAEEFCLPLLMYSCFALLAHLKQQPKKIPLRFFLIHGSIAGIVLWIKYSLLGFWFGFMAFFFFYTLKQKQYSLSFLRCLVFLSGMILPTIPVLCYFGYHQAIPDLFQAYFLVNIQSYTVKATLLEKITFIYQTFFTKIIQEHITGILILLSGYFFYKKEKKKSCFYAIASCFIWLVLSVYGGGRNYSYYFLIFAPFALFGLIFLFEKIKLPKTKQSLFVSSLVIVLFLLALFFQPNTESLTLKKEDYAQYQFAKTMHQKSKHPTLLNYKFLDGGFYLTSHTLPNEKYFQKTNIPVQSFPDNLEKQNEAIKNKRTEFVIALTKAHQTIEDLDNPFLLENYQVIQKQEQQVEGKLQIYYLFQKK